MGDFKDVEIIEVLVKDGQTININDSLITLESDKSSVEVPSTHSGKIEKINVSIGDKVNKGDTILTLESAESTKEVKKEVKVIEKDSNEVAKELQDKYGVGNIDLATGIFTKDETQKVDSK